MKVRTQSGRTPEVVRLLGVSKVKEEKLHFNASSFLNLTLAWVASEFHES